MNMEDEELVAIIAEYTIRLLVRGGYEKAALHDMVTRICNEEKVKG